VAALAGLAITVTVTWPVMGAAQAEAPTNFSRTSASGSYLAARHAGGQKDAAAAASYYRSALRVRRSVPVLSDAASSSALISAK